MPHTCFVNRCHNRSDGGKSFFTIPAVVKHQGEQTLRLSTKRRELWIAAINRKRDVSKYSKVCSDHFVTGKPAALYDRLHPDWVPSLLLSEGNIGSGNEKLLYRYNRSKDRLLKKNEISVNRTDSNSGVPSPSGSENFFEVVENSLNICTFKKEGSLHCTSEKSYEDILALNKSLLEENEHLKTENTELRKKLLSYEFCPKAFEADEKKVKYMTGLSNFTTLMAVFSLISNHISETSMSSISKFQKFVLVLMRFRLNAPVQDLAYRFGISPSTVSRIFSSVLHVLYVKTKPFIYWPDREQLKLTMPLQFRKSFGTKVAAIIDCFELFIERPSNLKARAQTWSQYKHKNTVKYLICITPQGSVSFLSSGWGGRTSDKYITEHCGFLEKLLPGDVVLADRGFDIQESVGLVCAEVKIPAFTKGKKQLSALEVEDTRKIANVRIHVERVIGLVRNKYTILQDIIPIDFLKSEEGSVPIIDKIVNVCSALSNFCDSVVPFD